MRISEEGGLDMEAEEKQSFVDEKTGQQVKVQPSTGQSQRSTSSSGFQRFVSSFTVSLENFFYRWGLTVASYPYQSIGVSLLFTLVCSMGLMNFRYEDRPDKLLISQWSQLAMDTDWLRNNFPSPVRFSHVMISAPNVLHPDVLQKIMEAQEMVEKIRVDDLTWHDVCFKLPVTKNLKSTRRKRDVFDEDDFFNDSGNGTIFGSFEDEEEDELDPYLDPMLSIPDDIYCSFVNTLPQACLQITPLELWNFNRTVIKRLTLDQIIHKFNHQSTSPVFGRPVNYTLNLGGEIVRNSLGEIVSANAIRISWAVRVNKTALRLGQAVKDDGTGELADKVSLAWEKKWLEAMEELDKGINRTLMDFHYVTGRSFGDVYKVTMFNDMKIAAVGYFIMFFYVTIQLGKFNMIEQRPFLSIAGISCAALGGLVTCGICSAVGLPVGNVNKVLPFLLLGIGVDDMFVIMQCWKNLYPNVLTKQYQLETLPHRIGMAVRTAGASITVTSLTDMAAFAIGATTLLPGLRSFCIYAAVGIMAVFVFQVTFFVGWFAVDQRRLEQRRHAIFFWRKVSGEPPLPNSCSQASLLQTFLEKTVAKLILSRPGKVIVICLTGVMLGVNINGVINLRQEFDPMWFLAQDSHIVRYIETRKLLYPHDGFTGFVVADNVNWTASFDRFDQLTRQMRQSEVIHTFDPWYEDFKEYSNKNFKTDIPNQVISNKKFRKYLAKFLFSRVGSKYRLYFKAQGEIECGERVPPVQISMMPFKFRSFQGRNEHIPGMNEMKRMVSAANMTFNQGSSGRMFPWSAVFVSWETDEIIAEELYRNVSLSLLCVLITIFFLLFNVRMCVFCGVCVVFTVLDVCGTMYYWGMSIDTISVIANVVAIGLCVDYAAHIGLAFMMASGEKNKRAKDALKDIGPAVLNGGFSTFLGIVLLSNSETHALQSFFKVLTSVVFFGLFHGVIFLPVVLSLLGPEPYSKFVSSSKSKNFDEKSHKNCSKHDIEKDANDKLTENENEEELPPVVELTTFNAQ